MSTNIFARVVMDGLTGARTPIAVPVQTIPILDASDIVIDPTPAARASVYVRREVERFERADLAHTPWIGVSFSVRGAIGSRFFQADPQEAVTRFKSEMSACRKAADIENALNRELEPFRDALDRMKFLEGAFKTVMEYTDRFSRDDQIRVLHGFAGKADTEEVKVAEREALVTMIGLLHRVTMATSGLEREQIDAKSYPRELALRLTDIYSAYARRSEYPRHMLKSQQASGSLANVRLAATILRLRDVAKRYELQRDSAGMASAFDLMMEIRKRENLRENEVTWAMNKIVQFMERHVSEWAVLLKTRGDLATISGKTRMFEAGVLDLVRSLYLYSPFLLDEAAEMLLDARLYEVSARFRKQAAAHRGYAERLGLL